MKITGVETFLIAVPFEHGAPKPKRAAGSWEKMESLLVRIDTDEGVSGWGEAFGFAVAPVTQTALTRVLAPLCIGRDAADLPATMAALRKATQNMGRSGPVRYALSGIDVALWDIAGKLAGKPLHALWGGAKRTAIPTYASFLPYRDVEYVERNTAAALERGYRHIKLHEHAVEPVAAARRVAGDGVDLMLDTNCSWPLAEALEMARALEPYALTWLEEPIYPPDDFAALAALRRQTRIPIALGENVGSAAEAGRAADAHALDVFQPDADQDRRAERAARGGRPRATRRSADRAALTVLRTGDRRNAARHRDARAAGALRALLLRSGGVRGRRRGRRARRPHAGSRRVRSRDRDRPEADREVSCRLTGLGLEG